MMSLWTLTLLICFLFAPLPVAWYTFCSSSSFRQLYAPVHLSLIHGKYNSDHNLSSMLMTRRSQTRVIFLSTALVVHNRKRVSVQPVCRVFCRWPRRYHFSFWIADHNDVDQATSSSVILFDFACFSLLAATDLCGEHMAWCGTLIRLSISEWWWLSMRGGLKSRPYALGPGGVMAPKLRSRCFASTMYQKRWGTCIGSDRKTL
ncbi:uncharacterized protein EDB91DRAFT_21965 [Suillus paluster]|uniref:uncharacterized protein n=1 Tax=Suillus paluster TaxID=48578 RepID=UPI001B862AA8|nr:uncharacterized protein EDB91DRAFT_21965 [Suillus paluster]KAG1756537.1 hypothetical protein EDB91DRAFT_21965 [Suillus paluster]